MKILVIDNDTVDRLLIIRSLEHAHFKFLITFQSDAIETGLKTAKTHAIDVVLCSYELASLYGLNVLRLFRDMGDRTTSVIVMSNNSDDNFALDCLEEGAQDFFVKADTSHQRLSRIIRFARERTKLEKQVIDGQEKLRSLAERDSLTGLGNRYYFDQVLKSVITRSDNDEQQFVLLLLDIDKFKNINDSLGHTVGDRLLKAVARRLFGSIRDHDYLFRLGGDEFAIIAEGVTDSSGIRLVVEKIFDGLQDPVKIDCSRINVCVSIGIASFPSSAQSAAELLKCADIAMYRAKAIGQNSSEYYSKEVHKMIERKIKLENDLHFAIAENQLMLYYQPQVCSESLELVGVEALIRWQHPVLGFIGPDEFIPIAEESGLIHSIGRWVVQTAIKQYAQWRRFLPKGRGDFTMSTNLSAREIREFGLIQHIKETLKEYDMPSRLLEIELTESCLDRSQVAIDFLTELDKIGIKLSLDDFGTGYSNLSHLIDFPIRVVKLDRSFVTDITISTKRNLLQAISLFAHSLEFETVAEGIETEEQKHLCVGLGVHRLQGYYFSKPVPPDEIEHNWLRTGR